VPQDRPVLLAASASNALQNDGITASPKLRQLLDGQKHVASAPDTSAVVRQAKVSCPGHKSYTVMASPKLQEQLAKNTAPCCGTSACTVACSM
jgi:hypothetical protein